MTDTRGRRRIPAARIDDPQGWLNGTAADCPNGWFKRGKYAGVRPLYFVP
jgi:hypothetical protein